MWRSSTTRLARLKQNKPTSAAKPAATLRPARVAVWAAEARRLRAMAGSAAKRSRDSISGRALAGWPTFLRSAPTTKVPRKEADARDRGQGPERPRLDVLDQGVGGGVAHLARLAGK